MAVPEQPHQRQSFLGRVQGHPRPHGSAPGHPPYPRRSGRSSRVSTAATSSTGTRTAWRSASAASCAPACARPTASTCGRSTTRPPPGVTGERYGFVYEINYLRCIHCDLCVEACPTEAITESKLSVLLHQPRTTPSTPTRSCGRRRRQARAPARGRTGARATTCTPRGGCGPPPVGQRRLRGPVQWSGELGYGVRAPESGQTGLRDDAATGQQAVARQARAPPAPERSSRGQTAPWGHRSHDGEGRAIRSGGRQEAPREGGRRLRPLGGRGQQRTGQARYGRGGAGRRSPGGGPVPAPGSGAA